jgi:hypothetical protein
VLNTVKIANQICQPTEAGITLAKVDVEGSSPFTRSTSFSCMTGMV